jgi:hypothetical protein
MLDRLNVFGTAVCALTATGVSAPDIIENFSDEQTVGYEKNVNLTARPSRLILADEKVTVELSECDTDDGTFVVVNTYNKIGKVVQPGEPIKFAFPRTTGKYLKAKATITKGVAAYVTCNVYIALEIG